MSLFAPKKEDETKSLFSLVNLYLEQIVPSDRTMKVLLLDENTLHIVSTSFSQTALLKKGVFLVDQVHTNRQRNKVKNMRCIIFIRPESRSVESACEELRRAKYDSYNIVFCGVASPEFLDLLARADVEQLVQNVDEAFCDMYVVNKDAFIIEHLAETSTSSYGAVASSLQQRIQRPPTLFASSLSSKKIRRTAEGIAAMFVAQRRHPFIRVQRNSGFVSRVAEELMRILQNDTDLYNYRHKESVLLLLDRNDDPVTPLLTPWTYQAMLHEHIGLRYNTLHLPEDVRDADPEGYVLSEQDDIFFAANMFLNWGDLCNNVKTYVDKCKNALNLDRSTATMDEIKEFMQRISQTKSLSGSVAKHATITTYLSHVVKDRDLLQVSLLEQDMVASSDANGHFDRLQAILRQGNVPMSDKIRLCLLYNLRYESASQTSKVQSVLNNSSSSGHSNLIQNMRKYYGHDRSTEELFAETGVISSIVRTFVDVGNIYTQHQPVLKKTLLKLLTGRLESDANSNNNNNNISNANGSHASYPYVGPSPPGQNFKPLDVTVFMCGGYTLEEAALVHAINHGGAYTANERAAISLDARVTLGGDMLLNSDLFVQGISTAM